MLNKPLIRLYFWGGYVRGGWLTSHENWSMFRDPYFIASWMAYPTLPETNGKPSHLKMGWLESTRMSQEVSKWLVNGLYPTYKGGILGL